MKRLAAGFLQGNTRSRGEIPIDTNPTTAIAFLHLIVLGTTTLVRESTNDMFLPVLANLLVIYLLFQF